MNKKTKKNNCSNLFDVNADGGITGCTENEISKDNFHTENVEENMSESSDVDADKFTIPHRYADAAEGIELRMANTTYFEKMTQNDLDYRVGKKGTTIEEFKGLAQKQGDEFTEEEKQEIDETLKRIEERFREIGFHYPSDLEIVFVKKNDG